MYTLEKVWPEWKIVKEIGRGSYGVVYKCIKEENNQKQYAAVKVISVPRDEFEMDEVVSEKMTQEQSKAYYKDIADDLLKEIEILKSLKGTKNIVEIYDAKVVEKEDGIGWNIFISMEMLTDFTSYASDKKFTQEDVIKLGTDLCSALSVCHKARIIHRDIKPENIFVDDFGNFKLGDFGVAKQMAKTKGSVSVKGTYGYMSPEVFSGKKCDGRADLYSLALVMYKLLNNNRFPFIDSDKQIIKYSERQRAFERRIKGESVPAIKGVSSELNAVILKACSFKSIDRQKNIDEFRKQLESVGKGKKSAKKVKIAVAAAVAAVVLVSAIALAVSNSKPKQDEDNISNVPVESEETRDYNDIAFLGMGVDELNSVNDNYLIAGKNSNDGEFYFVNKEGTIENLSEIPDMNKVYAYDDEILYYGVIDADGNTDIVRYDYHNNEIIAEDYTSGEEKSSSKKKPYINDVNIDSIVYFDDEYTYYVELDADSESKKLVKYSTEKHDSINNIDRPIKSVFEYNGYIIYSKDSDLGLAYTCYDAVNGKVKCFTSSGVEDMPLYVQKDKDRLYFAEKTEDNSIAIKYFDLKTTNNQIDSNNPEDKNTEADITEDTADISEQEKNSTLVAKFADIEIIKNMPEASWKINFLNEEFAIVSNENAQEGECKWYTWVYKYDEKELNTIINADRLFLEDSYEIFTEGDTVRVAVWESFVFSVYEIKPSGHVEVIGEMFAKEKKEGCYRVGGECFTIKDGVKQAAHKFDNEFDLVAVPEDMVYSHIGASVFMAPYENSNDRSAYLTSFADVRPLRKIDEAGKWSKLKVDIDGKEETVYMLTEALSDFAIDQTEFINKVCGNNIYDPELCEFVYKEGAYAFKIKGKKNLDAVEYDVVLEGMAKLNDNSEWELIGNVTGEEPPEDLKAMKAYIEKGKIDAYSHFSVYDIDHDGKYELIAHKKSGEKRHGVYYLTSDNAYEPYGKNKADSKNYNRISSNEEILYEIKDLGLLCYYENGIQKPDENGFVNLIIVSMGDNGICESKLIYKDSKDNIVPVVRYSVGEYADILE